MNTNIPLLKPARLKPGQTIGLIAPASPLSEDESTRAAIDTVESFGFRVKPGAHLFDRNAYLAGTDENRAADLNAMFADDSVDAIFVTSGGYGCARLLPLLNYDVIRANPKVIIGYSDITGLLNGIHTCTGLVTFHGPVSAQTYTPYTLSEFTKVLIDAASDVTLGAPPPFQVTPGVVERENRLTTFRPGVARGPLVGGNLSLMSELCGSPYFPDFTGRILFLEDVGESTYRIDRMLSQLWLSGALDRLAGIVFGKFTNCETNASWSKQFTVEEVLRDRCSSLSIPALRGLMIGHIKDQTTLPLGCQVELDAGAGTLRLLEPGVV